MDSDHVVSWASIGDGWRCWRIADRTADMSRWVHLAVNSSDHRQWRRYAWLSSGDQGFMLGGTHTQLDQSRMCVNWLLMASSSSWCAKVSVSRACSSATHSARCAWLHISTTCLQNLVTFWGCRLFVPRAGWWYVVHSAVPNKTSGSRSTPRRQWSPLMVTGLPKGCIQVCNIADATSGLPVIKSMAWLPHWWVGGFRRLRCWWWWRSTRSVSVNSLDTSDQGSLTGSFTLIHNMTSLFACLHCWICIMMSVRNHLQGFRLMMPWACSSHVCCMVAVFDAASNFWLQTGYPETTITHLSFFPRNSWYVHLPTVCPILARLFGSSKGQVSVAVYHLACTTLLLVLG